MIESKAKKEGAGSETSDDDLEFVSAETIQEIILWIYKVALRYQYFIQDLITFKDVKFTVKIIIATFAVFLLTFFVSDSVFLLFVTNAVLLWPLVYEKKRVDIDRVMGMINLQIDQVISKIPFLMNLEKAQRSQE